MSKTREVTCEFEIIHAKVFLDNGDVQREEYAEIDSYSGAIELIDISDESWYAQSTYPSGYVSLDYCRQDRNKTVYSMDSIERLSPQRTEDLVAVAQVPVEAKSYGLLPWYGTKTKVVSQDFEVDIWDRTEWEAHLDQRYDEDEIINYDYPE